MKSAIALAAVAGLATVASAQSLDMELSFDKSQILVGETAVATLTATLNGLGAAAYFSSITADFTAGGSGSVSASAATGLDWANAALGAIEAGSDNGGGLDNIFATQSSFLPPIDDSNPFVVLQFVVTGTAVGDITYAAAGSAASQAPGAFSYTDPTSNPFAAPVYSDAMSVGALEVIVPAPSSMALLGLGGLVATRRRR